MGDADRPMAIPLTRAQTRIGQTTRRDWQALAHSYLPLVMR
jgi:hypothetical protein